MSDVHRYRCRLDWSGSTAEGYEAYSREHRASCRPAGGELRLGSDPAFGGDPNLLNPEQLLVAAASSCQMLSFLAYAGRARIDVISCVDERGERDHDRAADRVGPGRWTRCSPTSPARAMTAASH